MAGSSESFQRGWLRASLQISVGTGRLHLLEAMQDKVVRVDDIGKQPVELLVYGGRNAFPAFGSEVFFRQEDIQIAIRAVEATKCSQAFRRHQAHESGYVNDLFAVPLATKQGDDSA